MALLPVVQRAMAVALIMAQVAVAEVSLPMVQLVLDYQAIMENHILMAEPEEMATITILVDTAVAVPVGLPVATAAAAAVILAEVPMVVSLTAAAAVVVHITREPINLTWLV